MFCTILPIARNSACYRVFWSKKDQNGTNLAQGCQRENGGSVGLWKCRPLLILPTHQNVVDKKLAKC